tara:strand:- start:5051 stop:5281 length:231 start_codon:yes stop_codon:yes gene_type:complete
MIDTENEYFRQAFIDAFNEDDFRNLSCDEIRLAMKDGYLSNLSRRTNANIVDSDESEESYDDWMNEGLRADLGELL